MLSWIMSLSDFRKLETINQCPSPFTKPPVLQFMSLSACLWKNTKVVGYNIRCSSSDTRAHIGCSLGQFDSNIVVCVFRNVVGDNVCPYRFFPKHERNIPCLPASSKLSSDCYMNFLLLSFFQCKSSFMTFACTSPNLKSMRNVPWGTLHQNRHSRYLRGLEPGKMFSSSCRNDQMNRERLVAALKACHKWHMTLSLPSSRTSNFPIFSIDVLIPNIQVSNE
jgi:hypothetical protein